MKFEELNLAPALLKAVLEQGYEAPTPIQAQAIPAVLAGHDLLAGAQTGTGKTAAFTLPMLHRLSQSAAPKNKFGGKGIRALVLTPTRELAAQVEESVREYGQYPDINATVASRGVVINPQIDRIKRGADILVATPAACSTCSSKVSWTCRPCRCWCSTKPTACWTWASSTT